MTEPSSLVVTVPGQPSHIGDLNRDYWELLQPDDEPTAASYGPHLRTDGHPHDDADIA